MKRFFSLFRSGFLYVIGAPLFVSIVSFFQMQCSVKSIPLLTSNMTLLMIFWNLLTVWLLVVLFIGIFKKVWLGLLIFNTFSSVISIINYYVLKYHGAPLSFHALKNFSTAMNVVGSYKFSLDLYSGCILLGFLICLAVIIWGKLRFKDAPTNFSPLKRVCVVFAALVLIAGNLYIGIFSSNPLKPKSSVSFSWSSSAGTFGFIPLQIETHFQKDTYQLDYYENYSEASIHQIYEEISSQNTSSGEIELPDIILILNECFFDLEKIVDLETDASPLNFYYSLEDAVTGYAVVPGNGGGTNRAEYELLTSSSNAFIPNKTPFQALDMNGHKSVVSFLENLGYETYGAHIGQSVNYNRAYSYPAMGFDHSLFDVDFKEIKRYGNRANTDESAYRNLISWYEEPSVNPKFMYLLTYQNHGGWEQNPSQLDTIRVKNDLGEYSEQVSEYLSSLQLSDAALSNLLDYFKKVDKPVIVCMVGDHSPSFAQEIADPSLSEQELSYLIRSTPFLIWSNKGLESQNLGHISLNYLTPLMLKNAGLPLSPFYLYQIDMMKEVPIVTSHKTFFDENMNEFPFDSDKPLFEKVKIYLNMCYNNLQEERFEPLFAPLR